MNRDTLFLLLNFLATVAQHSEDTRTNTGQYLTSVYALRLFQIKLFSGLTITGNKMDSNNLATVFAPNILHCIKPGGKDNDKPEDRIDIINVVRTMIDHSKILFHVPAALLNEVYVHMMDSHPEALDQLLNKRDAIAGADE